MNRKFSDLFLPDDFYSGQKLKHILQNGLISFCQNIFSSWQKFNKCLHISLILSAQNAFFTILDKFLQHHLLLTECFSSSQLALAK